MYDLCMILQTINVTLNPLNPICLQIRRYFDRADKNKDGKLSQEEWHRILNASGVPTSK